MKNQIKFIKKHQYKIILTLFIIAFLGSFLLMIDSIIGACPTTCATVQDLSQSSFLGIKNVYYGVVIFLSLIVITILQIKKPSKRKRQFIKSSIIIGSMIAAYFIFLQLVVINLICSYCMVVDISLILALLVIIITLKK